jgi:hypothetical protein
MSDSQADDLISAMCVGAVCALRRRAARQAEIASVGTTTADGRPDVFIRTGEAAIAARLAEAFGALASELEREGHV